MKVLQSASPPQLQKQGTYPTMKMSLMSGSSESWEREGDRFGNIIPAAVMLVPY